MAMRAQLIPLDGTPPIDIVKDMTVVGRKEECDICLRHKSISKMHCVIVKSDGLLLLRDLGSTNGTRVNGQRVRRAALLPNDQLAVAAYRFQVQFGPEEPPGPVQDRTQQLDPKEVAELMHSPGQDAPGAKAGLRGQRPLHPHHLPDVYPDDEKRN
jgi:pSer/pThr/pTyr-binding forkhead associated (FHA) protein